MRSCRLVVAAVALLAMALPCPGQSTHKDTRLGFSFKPPKGFKALAIEPTDKVTVAKYQDEQTAFSGDGAFNNMFMIRWYPAGNGLPRGEGESELEGIVGGFKDVRFSDYECTREKALKVDKAAGTELYFESPDAPLSWYIAILPQDDGVFTFEAAALSQRFGKESSNYSSSFKSFKRIDRADNTEHDAALAQMDEQSRFLQEQIDKLPPGWSHLRTARYLFLYNADKGFVQDLAERIEAIRDQYEKDYPLNKPIEAVSIVRVCASLDDYQGYGGPPGSGGYWYDKARELVVFHMQPPDVVLAIVNHEAFHQYIYYFYGELAPHSWYNEGTGDFYAGAKHSKSHKIQGFGDAPGGIGRLQTIKEGARLMAEGKSASQGAAPPLKELLGFSHAEYYGSAGYDIGLCYAAGWSVVSFLRLGKGLEPRWQSLLTDYLKALLVARDEVARETMEKAIAKAEKKQAGSGAELSRDVKDWYAGLEEDKVQDRAYKALFKDWTDDDWARMQAAWLKYVEKL